MAEKRKPGRPKKSVGLKPPVQNSFAAGLAAAKPKQVADGLEVQNVRAPDHGKQVPVLPLPQSPAPEPTRPFRVFTTDGPADRGAEPRTAGQEILDLSARPSLDPELRLSDLLRKLLRETAATEFQASGSRMTNAEVLARQLLDRALHGNAGAQEMVIDRVEGKAQRAAQVQTSDTTIDDQLDALDIENLNSLADKDST